MTNSLATLEAALVIGAGGAAIANLAKALFHGDTLHAVTGRVAYAAVWIYGLYRASYS
jgi:hypothetical protein